MSDKSEKNEKPSKSSETLDAEEPGSNQKKKDQ
jgi:hypothetical protein